MADIDPQNLDAPGGVEVAQISLPPLGGAPGGTPGGGAPSGNSEPIGQIENAEGGVTIVRVDGTRIEGAEGTPIFQGDSVETAADGSIGIVFSDATTFSLGPEGSMVIDEMIYDPEAGQGSMSLNIANGVFSMVSGQIAKFTPDSMTIDTPVATIGIRGTDIAGQAGPEGTPNTLTLLPGADGSLGEAVLSNAMGAVILNQLFATSQMTSSVVPPVKPIPLNQAAVDQLYGAATRFLPPQPPADQAPFSGGGGDAGGPAGDGGDISDDDIEDGLTEEEVAAAAEAAAAEAAGGQLTDEQQEALDFVEQELTPEELAAAVEQELQAQETLANAQGGSILSAEEEAIANAFLEVLQTGGSLTDAFAAAGTTQSLISSGVPLDQLGVDTGPEGPPEDDGPPDFLDFEEDDDDEDETFTFDDDDDGEEGGGFIPPPPDDPEEGPFLEFEEDFEDPVFVDPGPILDLDASLGDDNLIGSGALEDVLMIQGLSLGGSDTLSLGGGIDYLGLGGLSDGWGVVDASANPQKVTYTFGGGLSGASVAGTIDLNSVEGFFVEADNLTEADLSNAGLNSWTFSDGTVGVDTGFNDLSSGYFVVGAGNDSTGDSLSLADGETADGLIGGSGIDSTAGNLASGILFGLGGADTLQGSYNNDILVGGQGNDVLIGGAGDDHLIGDDGDDGFTVGTDSADDAANDYIDGGTGTDTITVQADQDFSFATITDVEALVLGSGVTVSATSTQLSGMTSFTGDAGSETLGVVSGDLSLAGASFTNIETLNLSDASVSQTLTISSGTTLSGLTAVAGAEGSDRIEIADSGVDISSITSLTGVSDIQSLDTGDTTLTVSNDLLGIAGLTISDLGGASDTLVVAGSSYTIGSVSATISDWENLSYQGTSGADTITGSANADTIDGLGDNDTLRGEGGNDTINGGDGSDDISGGSGDDVLNGGAGDDIFYVGYTSLGGSANDTTGGSIDGGAGTSDSIRIQSTNDFTGVAISNVERFAFQGSSNTATFTETQVAAFTTIQGNSNLANALVVNMSGTSFDYSALGVAGDTLNHTFTTNGTTGDDTITLGQVGNMANTVNGGTGGDTITGGSNADVLNGELGNDIFVYTDSNDGVADTLDGGGDTDTIRINGFAVDLTSASISNVEQLDFITNNAVVTMTDSQVSALTTITFDSGAALTETLNVSVASGASFDLSGATISNLSGSDAININATTGAETIIGNANVTLISAGSGADTINSRGATTVDFGASDGAVDRLNIGSASDMGSTVQNFEVGTDLINVGMVHTQGNGTGNGTLFDNNKTTADISSGTAGYFEITQATASMAGTATASTAVSLATTALQNAGFSSGAGAQNLIVVYDNAAVANAAIFRYNDSTSTSIVAAGDVDGQLDSGELHLHAFLEGVGANALSDADFEFRNAVESSVAVQTAPFNATAHGASGSAISFSGGFTMEVWINPTSLANAGIMGGISGSNSFDLSLNATGEVSVSVSTATGTLGYTSTAQLNTGTFYHLSMVYDGSNNLQLYIDGSLAATTTDSSGSPGAFSSSLNVNVGSGSAGGSGPFVAASVGDFRVWDTARTGEEIGATYDQLLHGTESNLAAWWRLNGDVTDSSSNGNDLVFGSGNPSYSSAGLSLNSNDPLVFDLNGDGVNLLGADAGVTFDRNGDGTAENTGWFGPDDGLLVADLNANGRVDDFSEVVSPTFAYRDGAAASTTTSFDALALFDDNDDGSISVLDEIFGMLKIWQDGNSDGETQVNELLDLSDVGITSISLETTAPDPQDILGNTLWRSAQAQTDDGGTMEVAEVTFDLPAEAETQADQADQQVA
ncbi:MAG: LamG-like jellyroll fold domain-containing protein [Magnetovibrionaceae bacterium]